jgi:hypothetical protein
MSARTAHRCSPRKKASRSVNAEPLEAARPEAGVRCAIGMRLPSRRHDRIRSGAGNCQTPAASAMAAHEEQLFTYAKTLLNATRRFGVCMVV